MNGIERIRNNFQTRQMLLEMAKFSVAEKGLKVNFRNVAHEYRQLKKVLADAYSQEAVAFHKKLSEYINHDGFDVKGGKFKFSETKFEKAKQKIDEAQYTKETQRLKKQKEQPGKDKYIASWQGVQRGFKEYRSLLDQRQQAYQELDLKIQFLQGAKDYVVGQLKPKADQHRGGSFNGLKEVNEIKDLTTKFDAILKNFEAQKAQLHQTDEALRMAKPAVDAALEMPKLTEKDLLQYQQVDDNIYGYLESLGPKINKELGAEGTKALEDLQAQVNEFTASLESQWKPKIKEEIQLYRKELGEYGKAIEDSRKKLRAKCDKEKANLEAMKSYIQDQNLGPDDRGPSLQAINQGLADIEKIFSGFVEKFHSFDAAKDFVERLDQAANGAGGDVKTLKDEMENTITEFRKCMCYRKDNHHSEDEEDSGYFDLSYGQNTTLRLINQRVQEEKDAAKQSFRKVSDEVIKKMTPDIQEIVKTWQYTQALQAQTNSRWDGTNIKISDSF